MPRTLRIAGAVIPLKDDKPKAQPKPKATKKTESAE